MENIELSHKKIMPFNERRVRHNHDYHRSCVWHIAHLIRLENFFWNVFIHYSLLSLRTKLYCASVQSCKLSEDFDKFLLGFDNVNSYMDCHFCLENLMFS